MNGHVITSLAIKEDRIYVADAGNRKVLIYNSMGEIIGEFEGKTESEAGSWIRCSQCQF